MSAIEPTGLDILHVSKRYGAGESALVVLDDVTLHIRPGEFVSVLGTSGCGKSTLLRLIAGLDAGYSGAIMMRGERVGDTSLERGIVFQDHRLFPWLTAEQNILAALRNAPLSAREKHEAAAEHIALVGLKGFERAYPHQLSGGMAQRVAIARGLVNRPRVLLLDEPFGALDALTRSRLQNELLRIWERERITMILVTHDVDEAIYLGDRVVTMAPRPGRIRRIVDVTLPRPRERADPRFVRLRDEILSDFSDATRPPGDTLLPDTPAHSSGQWRMAW
ncbi:ABC transporter ATP-binding protein [Paraburkholderia guartelaensis]|uniref:ABC transporter ATP-binding protein n=1 Tax=Paraburkholderia guartelaensis TaxID=2546446 RepID=UPI002AB72073|nr:ABC transporter ATP-binding protein [Paraburkholderia guartelaensis]